jgi:Cu/Ag efflux protein CusF
MLPAYMLRQLYAKGSMKNLKEGDKVVGFSFSLKNKLGSANLKGEVVLAVDGQPVPPDSIILKKGDTTIKLSDLVQTPMKFSVGDSLDLTVMKEGGLIPGQHKVDVKFHIVEFGKAQFDVTDTVTA